MRKPKSARHPAPVITKAGASRRIWQKHSFTVNVTTGNPGFLAIQVKANDPYRPDPLNNVSPNGWSQYGGIYNYAHVVAAKCSVTSWMYDANNAVNNSISWGDANYAPAIGTAIAAGTGYTLPAFHVSNGIGLRTGGPAYSKPIHFQTPIVYTKNVLKEQDETQDATTVAGGGAASPGSLWYFNILTQPQVPAANKNILTITLYQLVDYYDSTGL